MLRRSPRLTFQVVGQSRDDVPTVAQAGGHHPGLQRCPKFPCIDNLGHLMRSVMSITDSTVSLPSDIHESERMSSRSKPPRTMLRASKHGSLWWPGRATLVRISPLILLRDGTRSGKALR